MTETLFPETRLKQIHSREGSSTKAIAVIPGKSNSVHIRDIPLPDIRDTEVLVKVGLITAMLLKIRGFDVVSVDRSDNAYKDMIFRKAGIIHFNTGKVNLHNIPMTLGRPIDFIVEETGSSSVALHSMMVVGNNGVVVLTSITGGDKKMEICSD